jgi:hypothetical protein
MFRIQEAKKPKKGINPIWRGIGCVTFLLLTVGVYFGVGWAIDAINEANRAEPFLTGPLAGGIQTLPVNLFTYEFPRAVTEFGPLRFDPPLRRIPINFDLLNGFVALLVAVLAYAAMVVVWAFFKPPKLGPKDAPPVYRKIDRSKVR